MPLFLRKNLEPEGEVGVWEIREDELFFLDHLELTPDERTFLSRIKGKGRRIQWLASRYLLHIHSGRKVRGTMWKDEFGKPHLNDSPYQVSLSHSHEMAAVIGAPFPVGIDIQFFVPKIGRLAPKYMRVEEFGSLAEATRLEHMHVYWGAKEAIYKAYGRRRLDFRENILIEPFAFNEKGCRMKGKILKEDFEAAYELWFEKFGSYFLVFGREV